MSMFNAVMMFILTGAIITSACAQSKTGEKFISSANVAIDGYDVVGYFTQNLAIRGNKKHSTTHAGTTYYFASADNKNTFEADPEKYLPQYGGWCAFAMAAKNTKFAPDPKTFKLYNGKLLLFYNGEHGNTIVPWNNDEQNMRSAADKNWAAMN